MQRIVCIGLLQSIVAVGNLLTLSIGPLLPPPFYPLYSLIYLHPSILACIPSCSASLSNACFDRGCTPSTGLQGYGRCGEECFHIPLLSCHVARQHHALAPSSSFPISSDRSFLSTSPLFPEPCSRVLIQEMGSMYVSSAMAGSMPTKWSKHANEEPAQRVSCRQ